jgi:hypothetical protein
MDGWISDLQTLFDPACEGQLTLFGLKNCCGNISPLIKSDREFRGFLETAWCGKRSPP